MIRACILVAAALLCSCKDDPAQSSGESSAEATPVARQEPSDAAPPPIDAAPKRPPAAYFKALRRGRKLARSKKYDEALAAFDEALAAWPADPVVLSEISWVAFSMGEHDRAVEAGSRSVELARRPTLRAASLYNLGRAFEAKGVKESAIIAYQSSLLLRPNDVVAKRLGKLLGKKVEGGYTPVPLAGPMALPEVCEQKLGLHGAECKKVKVAKELAQLMPPYKQVAVLEAPAGGVACVLAIHLEAGWYVAPGYLDCRDDVFEQTVESIQLAPSHDGAPMVRFDYEVESPSSRFASYSDSYSVVCGIGASGAPSCSPAIHTQHYSWELEVESDDEEGWSNAEESTEKFVKQASLSPKGVLTIEDEKGSKETFELVFP